MQGRNEGEELNADRRRIGVRAWAAGKDREIGQVATQPGRRSGCQLLDHSVGQHGLSGLAAGHNDRHAFMPAQELENE